MNIDELFNAMEEAGFTLPRKKNRLNECRVGINPCTGSAMFEDQEGRFWSWDKREAHFDVLSSSGTYQQITPDGRVIGTKQSTISYKN